ncbi:hypothetical protein JAAARDRAFT_63609 [Jaapia argillacea MUCL 33604]|uniref:Uncharacterized protein n=1 Tax=Jaapia argillacea MUCL 33604 TaxID=933084 RepID=A0A067P730_9AGAM|nr:hypothetical protein JAAARDRAFT_63609 [Jaapia argillacea MUCL 33604]
MLSNFLANSPLSYLCHLLTPYATRLSLIPKTQVATQQGVQTRDLMGFLSNVSCWSNRMKQSVYAIKRDQMKGFDYLAPEGFHDAIRAYGLPEAIIDLDKAAQENVSCRIRTAYGLTEPILISGVNMQGRSASPIKSTFTTGMGHYWLNDLAAASQDTLIIQTDAGRRNDPHLSIDNIRLPIVMVEATDDSYIFAKTLVGLQYFCLMMERFQFTYGWLTQWSKTAMMAQIIAARVRAMLSLQPLREDDAVALDTLIASKIHGLLGFPFAPNKDILTLPVPFMGFEFPSISRINTTLAIEGLVRDLNHHVAPYRQMALITMADWSCMYNNCLSPLDRSGLSLDFVHYYNRLPTAWIVAQKMLRSIKPRLYIRQTDQSHVIRGEIGLSHAAHLCSRHRPNAPHGRTWLSLRSRGIQWLRQVGDWDYDPLWASDGSMLPALAGLRDLKTVTAAVTGPSTAIFRIMGRNSSILHGELFGIISALTLADENTSAILYTDHLNTVRLIEDHRTALSQEKRNVAIEYTRGHADDTSIPSRLNSEADHYASKSQRFSDNLPPAPIPTFFMDEYTPYSESDGWIESNLKEYISLLLVEQTSMVLGTGHKFRMATWLYDPRPPPNHPYTRAPSAYSATVQLYARSGQLPTALCLADRGRTLSASCRFGCQTYEDPHHVFVYSTSPEIAYYTTSTLPGTQQVSDSQAEYGEMYNGAQQSALGAN